MEKLKYIIGFLCIVSIVMYFSARREGLELGYYNSRLKCKDFCAKIKTSNACLDFNDKRNTKCLNSKDMLVSPSCYLYKNRNCMSMA